MCFVQHVHAIKNCRNSVFFSLKRIHENIFVISFSFGEVICVMSQILNGKTVERSGHLQSKWLQFKNVVWNVTKFFWL